MCDKDETWINTIILTIWLLFTNVGRGNEWNKNFKWELRNPFNPTLLHFFCFISFQTTDCKFVVKFDRKEKLSHTCFLISSFAMRPTFGDFAFMYCFYIITWNASWTFTLITKKYHQNECFKLSGERAHAFQGWIFAVKW